MSATPEISVVMSVYNGVEHLRETMDSILSQEEVDLELIIVNDGSIDKSGEILGEYQDRDQRIKIINQKNQGLTRALITGCAEARGTYIARQDVGDISLPSRLALQKAALDADLGLSFVSCWTEYGGPDREFLYLSKGAGIATTPMYIISENAKWGVVDGPTHHGSVMFRKDSYSKINGYRAEFYFGQDWDLWYRLAEIGKFQLLSKTLYMARFYLDSISNTNRKKQEAIAKLSVKALYARRKGLPDKEILNKAIEIRLGEKESAVVRENALGSYFIGECLRKNLDRRALKYFKQSIRANPLFLKPWVRMLQALWESRFKML